MAPDPQPACPPCPELERFHQIEIRLQEGTSWMKHYGEVIDEVHDALMKNGLIQDVDRLKQNDKRRSRHFWVIYPAIIVSILGCIAAILKGLL